MKKAKVITLRVIAILLLIIGLALIFNEQIKTFVVNRMTQTALKQPIKRNRTHKRVTYNFKAVKSVDNQAVAKAAMTTPKDSIGKIAVPSVNLRLPIFAGLSNSDLIRGAGTMKSDDVMGEGNYALAGHHMDNPNVLFSPLVKVKLGQKIYLTDEKNVYVYKVTVKTTVDKHQVNWIDDVPGKKLVTLVTCASGNVGENNRVVIRGELKSIKPANKKTLKVFTE